MHKNLDVWSETRTIVTNSTLSAKLGDTVAMELGFDV